MTQLASISEYELTQIKRRTSAGRKVAIEKGLTISGTVPYGYQRAKKDHKSDKVKIIINEEEAKIYKKIVTLALQGKSTGTIAKILNDASIPSRNGDLWANHPVGRILKNPVYLGTFFFNKSTDHRTKAGRIRTPLPQSAWKSLEVPPLITKRDYNKIHNMISHRTSFQTTLAQ